MTSTGPSPRPFRSINPVNGDTFGIFELHDDAKLEAALQSATEAWKWNRAAGVEDRAALLLKLADVLDEGVNRFAQLITAEMGKPISEARGEISKCAATCRTTAALGPDWLVPMNVPSPARASHVRFEAIGPILGIMPWNFPFWQVFRFFAPAFLAGNTTIIKHAENVPACADMLERIFLEAGMPPGVLTNIRVDHAAVGRLIADDRIRSVTVTGSVRAGRIVGGLAGSAGKRAVLELGGSDPFIVFDDADFEGAVQAAVNARFTNSGQSCVCAKRFFVQAGIFDSFAEAFVASTQKLEVGNPLDEKTTIGPIARRDLRDGLQEQLDRSLAEGAFAILSGGSVEGPGNYFSPAVLTNVNRGNTAVREELFGPIAPIISFQSEADALRMANDTEFGLAAALWTSDEDRAIRFEHGIESGAIFINDQVRSDAHISFGGTKSSGYGRELGSIGIKEFTNAKTVWRS